MGFKSKYSGIEVEELLDSIPDLKEEIEGFPNTIEQERSWVEKQLENYYRKDEFTEDFDTSKFLDKESNQDVLGIKNFVNGLNLSGKHISYNAEKNTFVFPASAIFEGGIAWNTKLGGFNQQTITSAVIVDGVTIGKDEVTGALYVKDGVGLDEEALKAYLDYNKYAKQSDIPTDNIQLKNGAGYIKSINSSMVINALGYTPLSINGGTINGNLSINGALTLKNTLSIGGSSAISYNASKNAFVIPGNLIIEGGAAWNTKLEGYDKQTITAAVNVDGVTISNEKGYLEVIGGINNGINETQLGDYLSRNNYAKKSDIPSLAGYATESFVTSKGYITNNISGDFNATGMVRGNYLSTGYIQISSNIDASLRTSIFGDAGNHWGQIKAFRTGGSASYGSLAGGYAAGILFAMNDTHGFIQLPEAASKAGEAVIGGGTGENIKWSAKLLHSLNYANYALPISGGTINGSLTVTASVTAPTFVGSLSGIADNSTKLNGLGASYYVKSPSSYDFASFNSGLGSNAIYEYRAGDGLSYAGDPVGSGYGVLMNIRDYRGYDGFQFLSTAASAWNKTDYRLLYRGKARSTSMDMSNGWSEIPLMDMSGNLVVKGGISWNSSRVLKNIVNNGPTYLSIEDMLKIKPYRYMWKDGRDNKVHAGGIADEVKEVLPEVVITNSDNIHSMDYAQTAFTMAASITPYVNALIQEVKELKEEIVELKRVKYGI